MSEPQTRYTRTADGVRIAFQYIEGRDPLILECPIVGHQFAPLERVPSWVEYREALRGDNAHVIMDYRGFRLSAAIEGAPTLDDFTLDVEAVAADIGPRRLVVLATASGAAPAVSYVRRHLDRVDGLILVAATQAFHPLLLGALRADFEGGLYMVARALYDWDSEADIRVVVQELLRTGMEEQYWRSVEAYEAWELAAALKGLDVPLIVAGPPDDRDAIAELTADLPGARAVIDELGPILNERAGHWHHSVIKPWLEAASSQTGLSAGLAPPSTLTARQLEVLRLVAAGGTNAAIADQLSIAPGTVARHVSDILNTVGLANRTEAARYAAEHGLLS